MGSQDEVSIYGLAEKIRALTASDSEIVLVPYDEAYETGFEDMQRRVPDISRIGQAIGWSPQIPLDNTLQQVIDFHAPG